MPAPFIPFWNYRFRRFTQSVIVLEDSDGLHRPDNQTGRKQPSSRAGVVTPGRTAGWWCSSAKRGLRDGTGFTRGWIDPERNRRLRTTKDG